MPLVWAHAEYLSLLRSVADGKVFDLLPDVAARYASRREGQDLEIWTTKRHACSVTPGQTLRLQAPADFVLHWTGDEWRQIRDTRATATELGIYFVDIPTSRGQRAPIRFTFRWTADDRWEGRDYAVRSEPLAYGGY